MTMNVPSDTIRNENTPPYGSPVKNHIVDSKNRIRVYSKTLKLRT